MIDNLVKYDLDYEKSIVFVKNQLDVDYSLSQELNLLNFKEGRFFTLLPEDADINRIYDFFGGLILPQNETLPQLDKITGEVKWYYTLIPTLEKEISVLISKKIKNENNYVGVFEDVQQELTDPHIEFFHQFGFSYSSKMYYFLSEKDASPELIYTAMREANALWHQLFIVTEMETAFTDQFKPGQEVAAGIFKEFVKNIRLLVLGAYDREGYFFWEPSKFPPFFDSSVKN